MTLNAIIMFLDYQHMHVALAKFNPVTSFFTPRVDTLSV